MSTNYTSDMEKPIAMIYNVLKNYEVYLSICHRLELH